jgi:hypothetical protein
LIEGLKEYCLSADTFEISDFRRIFNSLVELTPNLSSLKFNLPFQVIGRTNRTATLLLANLFDILSKRDPEFTTPVTTLALDFVSDKTLLSISNNPIDMKNALQTFRPLKNLCLSFKRQDSQAIRMETFTNRFWHLITEAKDLENLCLIGWNIKRTNIRVYRPQTGYADWIMKSFPYPRMEDKRVLRNLKCLELKRIDIEPDIFIQMIQENCQSLKELVLIEVFLKVFTSAAAVSDPITFWVDLPDGPDDEPQRKSVAKSLLDMSGLKLKYLKAVDLGYDDYSPRSPPMYDLADKSGQGKSFEERFVEIVMGIAPPPPPPTSASAPAHLFSSRLQPGTKMSDFGTTEHTGASQYKASIDGLFMNHNEGALSELQRIVSLADRGVVLMNEEIARLGAGGN